MNIKMYCLCLLNLFLHLKLKILEQNTKFNDLTMNSNEQVLDKKHKYCKICRGRLDRVKKYSRVQDTQLIEKINYLQAGIQIGDFICYNCTQSARIMFKKRIDSGPNSIDDNDEFLINNDSQSKNKNIFYFYFLLLFLFSI